MGIVDPLLSWFKSYLSQRKQRVVLAGQTSDWMTVEAGVPQGSILGPLLFLVYINDICSGIQTDINLFADDTSLLSTSDDPETAAVDLPTDLQTLQSWADQWLVTFNPSKTVSMCLSPKANTLPVLYLNRIPLKEVNCHRHLGITLAPGLSWKPHIEHVLTKASQRLGMLQILKYRLSRNSLEYLYNSYILSLLDYGDVLCDSIPQQQATSLDALHSCAARILCGCLQSTSIDHLLNDEIGWETLLADVIIINYVYFIKLVIDLYQSICMNCYQLVGLVESTL